MAMAAQDLSILSQPTVARDLSNILKVNARVCLALGAVFASQLGRYAHCLLFNGICERRRADG